MTWPTLPTRGFLAGRSATLDDVDRGNAVFCQETGGTERSDPMNTVVPQYALWRNDDGGEMQAILVQAERHITDALGDPIFGLRLVDGTEVVATGSEVRLLGQELPRSLT